MCLVQGLVIKLCAGAKEMCGLEFGSSVTNGFGKRDGGALASHIILSHKGMVLRESLKGMKVCL